MASFDAFNKRLERVEDLFHPSRESYYPQTLQEAEAVQASLLDKLRRMRQGEVLPPPPVENDPRCMHYKEALLAKLAQMSDDATSS